MDNVELKSVLRTAHDEITLLRREVASLEPRAIAYDTIKKLTHGLMPDISGGQGIDVAWRIKKMLDEID